MAVRTRFEVLSEMYLFDFFLLSWSMDRAETTKDTPTA